MAKADRISTEKREDRAEKAPPPEPRHRAPTPVYEKPRLRRYDQIDQVKPYGPTEI